MTAAAMVEGDALADAVAALLAAPDSVDSRPADGSRAAAKDDGLDEARRYLRRLARRGFGVPHWPSAYGGCDATPDGVDTIRAALRRFPAPDLYEFRIGTVIVGPALLAHATDDQKARWLPAIARGDEIVCQLFSEPDAGSDLANLATSAVRDGETWNLKGQKGWTSRAAHARWGFCLARSDPQQPKHRGLTMFMVDMTRPEVEVRPLRQMDGGAHFSEVFLDSVPVPDSDRVGDAGAGWSVALTALANERASAGAARDVALSLTTLPDWIQALVRRGATHDPVARQRIVQCWIDEQLLALSTLRAAATPGPAGSGGKLRTVQAFRTRAELEKDLSGADGLLIGPEEDPFLTSPSLSIRGGTNEIQRAILAERVLGLPAEPRTDRDVPWTVSHRGSS